MHPLLQAPERLPLFADPCANKHKGNQQSQEAFATVDVTSGQQAVLGLLHTKPMTRKEIARAMDKPLHAVSGRCSELLAKCLVRATGLTREGSMELELVRG